MVNLVIFFLVVKFNALLISFTCPGAKFFIVNLSMLYLMSLSVGSPTAAVILRTCLFFPSVGVSCIQVSGTFFLYLMGGYPFVIFVRVQ